MRIRKLTAIILSFVLLMTAVIFTSCDSGSDDSVTDYQQAIIDYYKAISTGNVEDYKKFIPLKIIEYFETDEQGYYESVVDYTYKSMEDKYGDDMELSFKFKDEKKFSDDEVKAYIKELRDTYTKELEISEAYEIEVKITVKGSKTEDKESHTLNVFKIVDSWYVLDAGKI